MYGEDNVVDRFQPVLLDLQPGGEASSVTAWFQDLAQTLDDILYAGRYKSLALTALEEALVWAYRSLSEDRA